MASYLNPFRHLLVFYFRVRKEDGEGGWYLEPPQQVKLWGGISPLSPSGSESSSKPLKAFHTALFSKGERYEVTFRALELSHHLNTPLAWIQWGKKRLYPLNTLQYVDEKQTYMAVQVIAYDHVTTPGGEA